MVQLRDDCFVNDGRLMPADNALAILLERLHPVVDTETMHLRAAAGRIAATDVVAERDVPPHDNSAVDGFAVYFDDLSTTGETALPVAGRAAAGHPLPHNQKRGEAVRIFTGAPMPRGPDGGPDTILMQEDCAVENLSDGEQVVIPLGIRKGANRRSRGEDVRAGATILTTGQRLRPQEIGLVASIGLTALSVYRPLRVALLSTGDEVFEPGVDLPDGGIYDANRYSLLALLDALGCEVTDLGILPDDREVITDVIAKAANLHDALITSAGMSVGEEDHLSAAVAAVGQLHFWKLAIKPGRPVALGQIGGMAFIGLPGNPAAMMVTFLRLARPALLRLAGATDLEPQLYKVQAGFDHTKKAARREYVRVRLSAGKDGNLVAHKFPREGAGILTSLVEADGLVELSEDVTQLTVGTMVDFLPFTEVSR
ncbi:MAG: molybdopterin molybdenumtransferase MoeA [Alphaproteobacteria bacterium]|nr:molybdopterin molybdenumtransferase MoeA [Alphaproteobacteria bacterium]